MNEPTILAILNQFFEIRKKIANSDQEKSLRRNLRRVQDHFLEAGYRLHDPTGEPYDLTRLDCEAMVSGERADNLAIVETVKPIIYRITPEPAALLQKGVVIVERKKS